MLSSCYDSDLFVNTNLNDLTCPIGLGVLRNPVFDEHGHVFCLDCIQQWLKKSNLCPINKQKIDDTKLVSALPLKGMINSLQMKQCPNKCAWNGKLESLEYHLQKECPEEITQCDKKGCEKQLKRKDLQIHNQQECPYTEFKCDDCAQIYARIQMENHQKYDCPNRQVLCEHCQVIQKAIQMKEHQENCNHKQIKCPIEGCNEQIKQQEVQQHIITFQHILLLQKQISGLQDQLKLKIPYLDGWKTSFGKKQESREWVTINTIERLDLSFELTFKGCEIKSKPNQWRGVIGVTYDRCINHHLWYKQNNSFVWIFGGFKCCKGAEKYGLEAQNENFTGKVILNNKGELSFQYNDTPMGVAFDIPEDIRKQGLYLIVSFINQGKIRLTNYKRL